MSIYRPGQGKYARLAAAAAMALVAMFGCYRLWFVMEQRRAAGETAEEVVRQVSAIEVLGLSVPVSALWAGGVFLVLAAFIAVLTAGIPTPIQGVNKAVHGFIDLLIDTQTELAKVVWPTGQKLVRATAAVITTVAILGVFLWIVDSAIKTVVAALIQSSQ